ncbi:MAG: T9SS type A sorting domain-containing protein [Bacteroidetes bacterium]|nr:T9SS type A sorting domain-containing protein [Bacteroidota bacterium]
MIKDNIKYSFVFYCVLSFSTALSASVLFDHTSKKYLFYAISQSDTVIYEYDANLKGTLKSLKCFPDGLSKPFFYPSNGGGIKVEYFGNTYYPTGNNILYTLLSCTNNGDTLDVHWNMNFGVSSINYHYFFYLKNKKSLAIKVTCNSNYGSRFDLDRAANCVNPKVIGIPYLPMINVLFSNNHFTTLYTNWENTESSEIFPYSSVYSSSSVYFAQRMEYECRANFTRRNIYEEIILTCSANLDNVLPDINNPVSPYLKKSGESLIFDSWIGSFANVSKYIDTLTNAGVTNVWSIIHNWQYGGYDNMFPQFMPAGSMYGGDNALINLKNKIKSHNYLFTLHENYVDYYPNSAMYNLPDVALNADGTQKTAWVGSYQMKHNKVFNYANLMAPLIHLTYNTDGCYLDVHSATNPSSKIDHDDKNVESVSFKSVLKSYQQLALNLRTHHNGPISGEGNNHFLYSGYFDDFEAQLNCGKDLKYSQGERLPLLVNFKLNKLHHLNVSHGVGYIERFYSNPLDGESVFKKYSTDSVLTYIATQLAYGNGAFIPTPSLLKSFSKVAKIQYNYVYPVQRKIYNATPVFISYNLNGQMLNASDYIRAADTNYDSLYHDNFMSQVKVEYNNGVVVYVNRNKNKSWNVTLPQSGILSFNCTINGKDSLYYGSTNSTSFTLPKNNGWLVYIPELRITAASDSLCQGDSLNLVANGAHQYNWFPQNAVGQTNSVAPTAQTTYTLVGTDINGNITSTTKTIYVKSSPTLSVYSTATKLCAGDSVVLQANGAVAYNWQPTNNTKSSFVDSPTNTTTYLVTGTAANGCTAHAQITVLVNHFNLSIALTPITTCYDSNGISLLTGVNNADYYTGTGVSGSNFFCTIAGVGTHTVLHHYIDNNGCLGIIPQSITVVELPQKPTILQSGYSLFTDGVYNNWYLNGQLIPNFNGQTIVISENGIYTVCALNEDGCASCSNDIQVIALSQDENFPAKRRVDVAPNPVLDGRMNIVISGFENENLNMICMIDINNKIVKKIKTESKKISVDTSDLAPGMYFLMVSNFTTKIIVK